MEIKEIINEEKIEGIIKESSFDQKRFRGVLLKAKEKKGLSLKEAAALFLADKESCEHLFEAASFIRKEIYGSRMVLFAPLYCSSYCVNRCAYCGFSAKNVSYKRIKLNLEEIRAEALSLLNMGHKRILLECGEHPRLNPTEYILEAIDAIYRARNSKGDSIRRVNVNIAATTVENYRKLAEANAGTYNLFQETYHQTTYETVHPQNTPKGDFKRQLFAMNRAIEGGLQDLGMGVLYGLYDWRFELLSLISHAQYLDKNFGIGPHAISVPRICPAKGVDFNPSYAVSDDDFLKIIAIIRLAIPYAGIVVSTRERPEIRKKTFQIGVSQTSAGSSTVPGGYSLNKGALNQFDLSDNRPLDEITYELMTSGFIPSHCTGCEFEGRMGKNFMPYAKSGSIKNFCQPNGLITLKEYLMNYASKKIKELGEAVIKKELMLLPKATRLKTKEYLESLDNGEKKYFRF